MTAGSDVWLGLRSLLWAALLPGVFAGYLPWRYFGLRDAQPDPRNLAHLAGLLCIGLGAALLATCIWEFARSGRGTLSPADPPRELVVRGLYRYVRNPMYLSVTTIVIGELLLTGSRALLVYWIVWFAAVNLFVIGYEEPALRRSFGASYDGYTQRVGRWLPRRHAILSAAVVATVLMTLASPPLPQPSDYHSMADERVMLGIPNALNVLSNVPFAIVGLLGLAAAFRRRADGESPFLDPWERWPYAALFAGVGLTALGSSYYHLAPDNARLVWDRLPMTLGFMGLLTALLAERVSLSTARWLFAPLLAIGAGSVGYWYWSELQNAGDLRLYVLVQFGSLLVIVLLLVLYPRRYPAAGYLVAGLAAYAAAKGLELADEPIFALGQIVSGHTLKHLAAAGGVACLVAMLNARARSPVRPVPEAAHGSRG